MVITTGKCIFNSCVFDLFPLNYSKKESTMNGMNGFFAELYMNAGDFGRDGRGLSKNRSHISTQRVGYK